MKKQLKLKLFTTMWVVLMMTVGLTAQSMGKRSARFFKKPDLKILKITVDRDCNLAVVVKNDGPGMLPETVYTNHHPKSAGVYVYINGKRWGGQTIWKFDPAKKLKKPGGIATCTLNYKVTKKIKVKAVVDLHNDVKEKNERNNTLTRNGLICRPSSGGIGVLKLPDLTVTDIRLVKNCKIEITIRNIGKAGVPDSFYNLPKAVAVQMYKNSKPWGGLILSGVDPQGKLKSPGGTVKHIWFPNAQNLNLDKGTHSIKVVVDNSKVLTESNENNNARTERLKCKGLIGGIGTPSLYKNSITDIRFKPGSPASLNFDQRVNIKFKYTTTATGGIYIFARPMTKGNLSPNYAAHPSGLKTAAKGSGDGFFTITKGAVTVDAVRFQMVDKSKTNVLLEKIVRVKYSFPKTAGPVPSASAPQRFFLDFNDAYLAYVPSTKAIQIIAQKNVLSYGGDWEKRKLKPYLYHFRQKVWKGFYWAVNTSRKEVYRVKGGQFGKLGGNQQKLNIKVDVVGGSDTSEPTRFFLRFSKAYLVYVPKSKTIQVATEGNVLSYGGDWDKCNLKSYLYHLRLKTWQGFYWKINTSKKKAWRVRGGSFCNLGGSEAPLNVGVRVVK